MKADQSPSPIIKKSYAPPAVERVILDPIKEMLESCPSNLDGKAPSVCLQKFS